MIHPPFHIAVVEDNESVSDVVDMTIGDNFSADDLVLHQFNTIDKAKEFLAKNVVHIVITDVYMGKDFGDSFMRDLVKTSKLPIMFIVMSGDSSFTTISNTYLDGAMYYLLKPFRSQDLVRSVKSCIDRLESWTKLFEGKHRKSKAA